METGPAGSMYSRLPDARYTAVNGSVFTECAADRQCFVWERRTVIVTGNVNSTLRVAVSTNVFMNGSVHYICCWYHFDRENLLTSIYVIFYIRYFPLICLKQQNANLKQKMLSSVITAHIIALYLVKFSMLWCSSVLLHNQCSSSCTPLPLLLDTDANYCTQ